MIIAVIYLMFRLLLHNSHQKKCENAILSPVNSKKEAWGGKENSKDEKDLRLLL
jgi:hypothetical protein